MTKRTAALCAALAVSLWAAGYAIDFSVYYTAARGYYEGGGALYGDESGLVWPMWYRYPPFFLLLFWPFSLPPFPVAAFLWALLKCAILGWLVARLGPGPGWKQWLLAAAIAGPAVVSEIRYGNAQFFVFAFVAAALLWAGTRPRLAALALGTAIAVKVWPLFFVPYAAAWGRWRLAAGSVAAAVVLTLAPAAVFGWGAHLGNLESWYVQEYRIAASGGSIWFPSQSLLGVMTRHLTDVSYRHAPDSGYPLINWMPLDPELVRKLWMALAATGYAGLLWAARRCRDGPSLALHGIAFCALILLEPYAQKQTALTVLVLPAMAAAGAWDRLPRWGRGCLLAAAALSLLQPLTLSGWWNRVYQVWGLDALLIALLIPPLFAEAMRCRSFRSPPAGG